MEIIEIPAGSDLSAFIALSADWEKEDITWGLRANTEDDLKGMRIFGAYDGGRLIGYVSTSSSRTERTYSMVPQVGTHCWEIEELYVIPEMRGMGIGRKLFEHAENAAQEDGAQFIFLSTATKDYRKILHFYIDELGMEFWSARLFKPIKNDGI